LLAQTVPAVDGLFLGRRAHDVAGIQAVLDEAADIDEMASSRPAE
jgi:hypothetical protein